MVAVPDLIDHYQLAPHPDGGWYRELHRSALPVTRPDGQERSALTLILFLLAAPAVSRWHRVSQADETWHFIAGDPLELITLPEAGGERIRTRLGFDLADPLLQPVVVVPADCWQAAHCLGDWSLVSCCVGPGFSFTDFSLLADQPASSRPHGADALFL